MPSTSLTYRTALRLAASLAPAAGLLSPRLRQGIEARRDAGARLLAWARSHRDQGRPLAWFHAASAGEGLQAEAVLRELRRRSPSCQMVYTHFSPSAAGLAARIAADVADYLPYDTASNVDQLLDALKPDLLVFAKLDLWPELSTRASTHGADVAIVAGTVSPGSSRLRWPARMILQPGYRVVAAAAAVSPEDAARLVTLGVDPERIRVLGDPRFDSVVEKVAGMRAQDPLLRFGRGAPTLVAGSTWPEDEEVLLRAYAGIRSVYPSARLILVPHEPAEHHLKRIERAAVGAGVPPPVRLSAAVDATALLLIDRLGVLAGLYGAGTMAYVGGGFGRAGLHSVLEPAAWSLPVTFGPRWTNSRDAALLLDGGGGTALPPGTKAAITALEKLWSDWIRDDAGRMEQGRNARQVVERGRGASESSAEMLLQLISSRFPRMSLNAERSGRR
ncbi:MAG TPA: glycosyltransferase N-terminal domain-containing protein [Gemmatimonadales bacterium]|nr:glycosyltransferase N-terminal domain-containing protein [Gemmatimonadales bacterium]